MGVKCLSAIYITSFHVITLFLGRQVCLLLEVFELCNIQQDQRPLYMLIQSWLIVVYRFVSGDSEQPTHITSSACYTSICLYWTALKYIVGGYRKLTSQISRRRMLYDVKPMILFQGLMERSCCPNTLGWYGFIII